MIRFDTRDRKPKLYDLLAAAGAIILAEVLLVSIGGTKYTLAAAVLQTLLFVYILVRLVTAFFGQLRYNPYSYNTIFYFGFAVFDLFVIIEHILLLGNMIAYPEVYTWLMMLHTLLGSATTFMILTFPFLFVFSVALFISNISLIRHEGRRFVNILGMILAVLLVGGVVFIFFYDRYASGSQFEVMMHDLLGNLFASVYLYFECMILGVIVADAIAARYEPDKDKDYMIVLGCGIRKDGTPNPLLKSRLDRAIEFYITQKEESGKELRFITSGGQGPDEPISESLCMKNYLISQGIPEELIIEEDRSTTTQENMRFSKEKIKACEGITAEDTGPKPVPLDPGIKVAFSTTNYHVFRSGLFARRVKMRAQGIGAKTRWYFWPNAAVREFMGLLTAHKLKQAIILGSMIVFYVVVTVLSYSY